MKPQASRQQIIAFQLAAHHLDQRLLPADLLSAAGACGIQDSPPGSAALALNARIDSLTPSLLDEATCRSRALVGTWCMRGAPFLLPVTDLRIFTTGLLPENEADCLHFIRGAVDHLARFRLTAMDLVSLTTQALERVLSSRQLTKDDLGRELALSLEPSLLESLRPGWREPDGIGQNTYGESLVRYALYVVALQGLFCLVPKAGRGAVTFALTREWLGGEPPVLDQRQARAEHVRRYLHCYGPDGPAGFAQWSGTSPNHARASFNLVRDELTGVETGGRERYLLQADAPALAEAVQPACVRLLPPGDPFLAPQQKHLLVPDARQQRRIWMTSGSPGVVLVDGEIAAIWRPQKRDERLTLTVEPISGDLSKRVRDEVEAEAHRFAAIRQVQRVSVGYIGPG